MKKILKQVLSILLGLSIAAGLMQLAPLATASGQDTATEIVSAETLSTRSTTKPTKLSTVSKSKTMRILLVGNSFSVDSSQYLYDVAQAAGYTVVVGNLYKGSATLANHLSYAKNNTAAYTYRKNSTGQWESTENARWSTALKDEKWDVIFFQPQSGMAGRSSTYYNSNDENYLNLIAAQIRKSASNPSVKVGWQMTWALGQDTTDPDFDKYYSGDQMTMYRKICSATQNAAESSSVDFIVHTGTAVQNARSSYFGDTLNRDGKHLSKGVGRYLAAMSIASACGLNLSSLSHISGTKDVVSDANLAVMKSSVSASEETPYAVTTQTSLVPTLASPVLTLSKSSGTRTLTWKDVSGATSYIIQRKLRTDTSYSDFKTVAGGKSSYAYKDSTPLNNTIYFYRILAVGDRYISTSTGSGVSTCYVTKACISSLKNVKTKKITVKWKENQFATGYQVQYATNSSFTQNKKTITVTGGNLTKTLSGLAKGKKYYVRVRAYIERPTKTFYSDWSSTKTVTVSQ
jgi:hypothetical protein